MIPSPSFPTAASGVGITHRMVDRDGVVRRGQPLFFIGDDIASSFPFRLAAHFLNLRLAAVRIDATRRLTADPLSIPLSPDGQYLIHFSSAVPSFPRISAKDLIDGTVPAHVIEGRLVLFISSAVAPSRHIRTPIGRLTSGEVFAHSVDSLLTRSSIHQLAAHRYILLIVTMAAGALLVWTAVRFGGWILFLAAGTLIALMMVGNGMLLVVWNIWQPVLPAVSMVAVTAPLLSIVTHLGKWRAVENGLINAGLFSSLREILAGLQSVLDLFFINWPRHSRNSTIGIRPARSTPFWPI